MPDIFLSYNREDQATARRFAEAFQAEGFDVWWDTTLRAGEAYDQVTEKALKTAKAVVVLWSKRSVESRWVRAEATLADRNKTLVPVTIEPCERPIMFELTQTAELSHWEGDVRDKTWQAFMGDLKRFVQAAPVASRDEPVMGSRPVEEAPVRQATVKRDRLSICVLPFANMSRDEDQEYFADGISEDIITDLSKVSALHVISRNTAFTFKGKSVEVRFGMNARAFQRLLRRDYLGAEDILLRAPPSPASGIGDHLVDRIDLMFQEAVGHYRQALEGFRSLVRQNPSSLLYSMVLQENLDLVGQREEAQAEYLRSKDLAGDHEIAELFAFLRAWGRAEADAVEAQYQRLLACGGSRLGNPLFAQLAGVLGDREAANELITAAFEDSAVRQDPQLVMYLAQLAGLFDNADVALSAMRLTYLEMRFTPMRGMWMPQLAQARQGPRFKEMLRDLGLAHYWRASANWGDFVRPVGDDDFEVVG